MPIVSDASQPVASLPHTRLMFGTLLNCAGILLGGLAGLLTRAELPPRRQLLLKITIGVALVWFGLKIAGTALLAGGWRYFGRLFLILLVAMIVGRVIGRLLRFQRALNCAGKFAKEKLTSMDRNDGLLAAAILFAAAPLGVFGAVEDGLANEWRPLLIKGAIDGLAAFAFARVFGWRMLCAVIPVAAMQGSVSFGVRAAEPWLQMRGLIDPIHVVCGFLLIYVSMIVFEIKKVDLGDYVPAIIAAPAIAWLLR